MSAHKHGLQLADDDLVATIEDLAADGETIAANGGVLAERAAEELPFAAKTVSKRCATLADAGRLETAWGFYEGQQRKSYLPAASDAAPGGAD